MTTAEWALVMNATRARILRGLSPGAPPELVMRAGHRRLRAMLADRRGLELPAGSQVPDPLHEDDRDFVREVVAMLEAHRLAGDFEVLTVIAAPRTYELLHEAMPGRLAARVHRRTERNLAAVDPVDLPRLVGEAFEPG